MLHFFLAMKIVNNVLIVPMEHIVNLNISLTLAEKPILLVNALRNLNVMTVVLAMKIVNNVPIVPMEHTVTFQETQGLA